MRKNADDKTVLRSRFVALLLSTWVEVMLFAMKNKNMRYKTA